MTHPTIVNRIDLDQDVCPSGVAAPATCTIRLVLAHRTTDALRDFVLEHRRVPNFDELLDVLLAEREVAS